MKIYYEKYDDTVQYLGEDKVSDWQPSKEYIVVEILNQELNLTTRYEDGLTSIKKMSIIEANNDRLIAQHLDEHLGITIFVRNPEEGVEATLTLINHDYIVGRYLKEVAPTVETISNFTNP